MGTEEGGGEVKGNTSLPLGIDLLHMYD